MKNLQKDKDLYINNVKAYKLSEGFEKYYSENVLMQDVGKEPRIGKEATRVKELKIIQSLKEIFGASTLSFSLDSEKNKTMVDFWMNLTFANEIRLKKSQLAEQTLEKGLIKNKTFYHN